MTNRAFPMFAPPRCRGTWGTNCRTVMLLIFGAITYAGIASLAASAFPHIVSASGQNQTTPFKLNGGLLARTQAARWTLAEAVRMNIAPASCTCRATSQQYRRRAQHTGDARESLQMIRAISGAKQKNKIDRLIVQRLEI